MRSFIPGMMQKRSMFQQICILSVIAWLFFAASLASCWAVEADGSAGLADVSILFGMKRWSPYAAGFGIGVLSWAAFLLMGQGLGASSSFVKTSGMFEKAISGEKVAQKAYYQEFPPRIDRGWMIVAGIVVGSFSVLETLGRLSLQGHSSHVGSPVRYQRIDPDYPGFYRRHHLDHRRAMGRRLHQWTRDNRNPAACGEQLDGIDLVFCRRRCHSVSHLQRLCRLTSSASARLPRPVLWMMTPRLAKSPCLAFT